LAVDLKAADGLAIVKKLIVTAAVFVHNFRPGIAERMGLGEAAVREIRKEHRLRIDSPGSERRVPYARQRAYDPVIQALSGLADIQRDRDTGRPRMVRTIIADYTTALTAAQAITAALLRASELVRDSTCGSRCSIRLISYLWPEAMPSMTFRRRRN